MAVFAVIATSFEDVTLLEKAISDHFDEKAYILSDENLWLIDCDLPTTRAVAEKMGLHVHPNPYGISSYIVFPVSSYFGMQLPSTWEWLKSKGI